MLTLVSSTAKINISRSSETSVSAWRLHGATKPQYTICSDTVCFGATSSSQVLLGDVLVLKGDFGPYNYVK